MSNSLRLNRILRKFVNLNWQDKALAIEAYFLSGIIRLSILAIPFKRLRNHLGVHNVESPYQISSGEYEAVKKVSWAIKRVYRYTPWESKCLVQAMTAQKMLERRNICSTIYLGVNRDDSNTMTAHAWLRCGEIIVTGGYGKLMYKGVTKFSNYKECILRK